MLKIKDARPLYTGLFITKDEYTDNDFENGIVLYGDAGKVKPYQRVFKIGPFVKNVKEGDFVKVNFGRYIRKKFTEDDLRSEMPTKNDVQLFVPEVEIDGVKYYHIDENDVVMVITDWEEVDTLKIQVMTPKIIMPN